MNPDEILIELDALILKLNDIIDILIQSTKNFIDTGNVNFELKNIINRLDLIIDNLKDSNGKFALQRAKYDITFATIDIIDNTDIFDKISRLKNARSTLIEIKSKLSIDY